MDRLQKRYREEVVGQLKERFGYENVMQVPRLEKIVVNMGCGELAQDNKLAESLMDNLATITGQKPVFTRAKKSISNFKIREGMIVGMRVTLRRQRMYEFLDRFVNLAIPRIRDFRGVSGRSFDGRGNYALGLNEQSIFPEVDYDSIAKTQGMDINIVTNAKTDEEARELLRLLGMPFATS